MRANIDIRSRMLISEFPVDVVNFFSKLQSHCANMTFSEKLGKIDFSRKLHIKRGVRNESYQDIPKRTGSISFSSK